MRKYKRTYVRKKTGEVVTKIYTSRRTSDKDILVGKKGDKHEKRIENYLNQFDTTLEREKRRTLIYKLSGRRKKDEVITIRTIESAIVDTDLNEYGYVEKFLINAGYSLEDAAEELGITVEELTDEKNWDRDAKGRIGSKFTSPRGGVYQLVFRYRGSIWKKL